MTRFGEYLPDVCVLAFHVSVWLICLIDAFRQIVLGNVELSLRRYACSLAAMCICCVTLIAFNLMRRWAGE